MGSVLPKYFWAVDSVNTIVFGATSAVSGFPLTRGKGEDRKESRVYPEDVFLIKTCGLQGEQPSSHRLDSREGLHFGEIGLQRRPHWR